jgi:hypothetical protein
MQGRSAPSCPSARASFLSRHALRRRVPTARRQRSHLYIRKKKYAHLGASELRKLRSLEDENARLKRLVADLTLDKHMLAEALRKNVWSAPDPQAVPPSRTGPLTNVSGLLMEFHSDWQRLEARDRL